MEFELDEEAKKLFVDYYNHCQRLKFDHPKQGMRAMLGKAAEKVGRVATILHCIHAAHLGVEVSRKIPAQQVAAAIKWVEYTTQQALSINIEVSSPNALESNLVRVISLAECKGGSVTVRDVLLSFNPKYRPTSQKIREWFGELEAMKYGEVTEKRNSISFSLSLTSTPSTVSQNPYSVNLSAVDADIHTTSTESTPSIQMPSISPISVDKCVRTVDTNVHTFKTNVDKGSSPSVDTVDVFTPCLEIPKPLDSEHTTKPSNLNSAAKERTFELGDRVVVKDVGGIYQGARGEIIDNLYSRTGVSYLVQFEKPVRGSRQGEFESTDLMKL
jgi:hypothetical protein